MANYTTLRQGNSNTAENKKLQQALKDAGYGSYLGSAGVDGIYGRDTAAAVKAYQQDNGLQVDGIAGNQTLGKLYASNAVSQQTQQQNAQVSAKPEKSYRYDYDNDPVYQAAQQKVTELEGNKPTIQGTYDQQVEQLFQELMGHKDFQYDLNGDALWQQYKDQYTTQGKLAMMDTMGQAAALTGGYGSSYAQGVGQQAYQGYLQQMNDRVPELYQLAMDKYDNEQAMLKDKFTTAKGMQDDEYAKGRDKLSDWYTELGLAKDDADAAYDRGQNAWYTEESLRREDENTAYNREQDAYDKLMTLIVGTGYTPTAAELEAAGMNQEQATALAMQHDRDQAAAAAPYSGGDEKEDDPDYSGVKVPGSGSLAEDKIRMIQWSLGIETTGVWDQATVDASGYENSNECYEDWSAGKVVNAQEWTSYYLPKMRAAEKLKGQIKNMTAAEQEAEIRAAYEAGDIDAALVQVLLCGYGLV